MPTEQKWQTDHHGCEVLTVPKWDAGYAVFEGKQIWIESRPPYCDRGAVIAKTDLPIDHSEGWPRYYSSFAVAKSEVEKWLENRKEIHESKVEEKRGH